MEAHHEGTETFSANGHVNTQQTWHAFSHTHTHTRARAQVYKHEYASKYRQADRYGRAHTIADTRTNTKLHTRIRTHAHAHTHTQIHTYTHKLPTPTYKDDTEKLDQNRCIYFLYLSQCRSLTLKTIRAFIVKPLPIPCCKTTCVPQIGFQRHSHCLHPTFHLFARQ
jgi:hypothetical protein